MARKRMIIPFTALKALLKLNDEARGQVIRIVAQNVWGIFGKGTGEPGTPATDIMVGILEDFNDYEDPDDNCAEADFTEDDGGY